MADARNVCAHACCRSRYVMELPGQHARVPAMRGRRPDSDQNAGRQDLGILRAHEPAGQGSLVYSWGPARSPQATAFTRTCLLSARRPPARPDRRVWQQAAARPGRVQFSGHAARWCRMPSRGPVARLGLTPP